MGSTKENLVPVSLTQELDLCRNSSLKKGGLEFFVLIEFMRQQGGESEVKEERLKPLQEVKRHATVSLAAVVCASSLRGLA